MWFDFGRSEGFPTQYSPNATSVTFDKLEVGLIIAFVILAIASFVSLLTTRLKVNLSVFTRVSVSLFIGAAILIGNFGQEWEIGHVFSRVPYKAGISKEINASLGIKIGLRSVNVTLKSKPDNGSVLEKEIIDYNERFTWVWDQGRFGFGPYAGHLQQEFRAAQYRGSPIPILWIAEYFVIDGEGFRFGRFYRTAGWYTHIVLWTAFPCWLIANIFFRSVIHYGSCFLALTGTLQILAIILWSAIRNPIPLVIPFEDAIMTTKYGSSYWLTLISGILSLSLAIVIFVAHHYIEDALYLFFGVNPLCCNPEVYITNDELVILRQNNQNPDTIEMGERRMHTVEEEEDDDGEYQRIYLKRKSQIRQVASVLRRRRPSDNEQLIYGNAEMFHQNIPEEEDQEVYENQSFLRETMAK